MIGKKNKYITFTIDEIPDYIYILILLELFFCGGLIENQLTFTKELILQNTINRIFTVVSMILLIIIIIALIFICTLKSRLENTSLLLEKLSYSQAEHYKNIIRLNEEQKKFRHDYRNHMICIQALLEKFQYNDAKKYIQEITHKEIIECNNFFTGNQIADAILSDKSANAAKINTRIEFDGSIYDKLPMSDVCVILANALDNAIDACKKMKNSDKKVIKVKCAFAQNIQIIQVINPVEEDVQIYHNSVETTKSDKSAHGIGLYNIMWTVDKYGGEFNISCANKEFVLDIGFQVCIADDKEPIHD